MAIEIGILNNGSSDLPVRDLGENTYVVSGGLAAGQQAARRAIEAQVRHGILAERLGYDAWFQSEHHFQPEGIEFNPNPILTQMAIAAHTKRIRLGQAANIVTWWHPLRLAEQVAALDIVSGGRAEPGIGRGYQPREVETFGRPFGASIQDQERNRVAFEEAWEIIHKAWTEPSFSHHGENFSIPPKYTRWNNAGTIAYFNQEDVERSIDDVLNVGPPDQYSGGAPLFDSTTTLKELSVYPQPVQKPYPQCWTPMTSSRTVKWAAEKGFNGYFIVEPKSKLKRNMQIYYEAAEAAGFPDRLDRGPFKPGWDAEKRRGIAIVRWVHIAEKGIGDLDRAAAGLGASWTYLAPFGFASLFSEAGEPPLDPYTKITPQDFRDKEIALHGSKEFVTEAILRLKEEIGCEGDFHFSPWFDVPGLGGAEVEEQMQCFAEEIAPVLRRECGGGVELPVSGVELVPDTIAS